MKAKKDIEQALELMHNRFNSNFRYIKMHQTYWNHIDEGDLIVLEAPEQYYADESDGRDCLLDMEITYLVECNNDAIVSLLNHFKDVIVVENVLMHCYMISSANDDNTITFSE